MEKERCNHIDFLKFLGLLMIILAHVNSPNIVHQIRCFDVPLMLFASGLAFSGKEIKDYWKFVIPRTKRLVIPVWIFLTCYFIVLLIVKNGQVNISEVLCSYLLLNTKSIGYVWVIKVFLLIMLVTPLLIKLNEKKIAVWIGIVFTLFLLLEVTATYLVILKSESKQIYYFVFETFPFCIGYSIPFLFGLKFRYMAEKEEKRALFVYLLFAILVFVAFYLQTGEYLNISPKYKYPPRTVFMVYGILVSLVLWFSRRFLSKLADNRFISFYGRHTIWIYLWHIPIVKYLQTLDINWIFKFSITFLLSFLLFYGQYVLVSMVEKKSNHPFLKYLKE